MVKVAKTAPIYLIVNADDYGYFRCVSRGIICGAKDSMISAAGIMANGENFEEQAAWLSETPDLDLGVHLNLTYGKPLSNRMVSELEKCGGIFPGKYALVRALITGTISMESVREEWRAQIQRCCSAGLRLTFLNSHEHTHMFPPLFQKVVALSEEFGIPQVRFSLPEWHRPFNPASIIRNLLMQGFALINGRILNPQLDGFLGMAESGNISLSYLRACFQDLRPGKVYELMCHPGRYDPGEIQDERLLDYHSWESELGLLRGSEFRSLCERYGVRIIGYRDLKRDGKPIH